MTVGRSRACTLALTDPNASKEHLRIGWENGGYVVTDLGSSFGTRGARADRFRRDTVTWPRRW